MTRMISTSVFKVTTAPKPSRNAILMLWGWLSNLQHSLQEMAIVSFALTAIVSMPWQKPTQAHAQRTRWTTMVDGSLTSANKTLWKCHNCLRRCQGCSQIMQGWTHHLPTYWWLWHHRRMDFAACCAEHVQSFGEEGLYCLWPCSPLENFFEELHGGFAHKRIVERVMDLATVGKNIKLQSWCWFPRNWNYENSRH